MRMLVASVQHTARFFKTHPLPVLLQAFIFALQSHKLFSTHSCTFWTACNFERLVFSFLLSLTPVSDRTCLLPAGVWIVCRSGACHIADYQIIDPVRKVLNVNFPREVGLSTVIRTVGTFLKVLSNNNIQLKSPVYCSSETSSFFTTIPLHPVSLNKLTVLSPIFPLTTDILPLAPY